jgi:hypothetical protein
VIQLTSPADGDLSDASDVNTSVSSGAAAGQGDTSLFGTDPSLGSAETDVSVGNFTAVTLDDDTPTSLVSPGDIDFDDGVTDTNTSASNGTAVAPSDVSLFEGKSFLGSSEADAPSVGDLAPLTLANNAYSFAMPVTDWLGNTGAASAAIVVPVGIAVQSPFTVNPIQAIL